MFTAFGVFACSAWCGFGRSRLRDLCSFISSILRRFPLSETQYSCMISKSLFKVFGLRRSRYYPHGPRLRPAIAASMMVFSSTFGALARSLTRLCKYSCSEDPPCFRLWKAHELTSSGFGALKAAMSSLRSWSHMWMCPPGRFEYQCCARPFSERTNALTLHAAPPPDASMSTSYLRRESFGSESHRIVVGWWG